MLVRDSADATKTVYRLPIRGEHDLVRVRFPVWAASLPAHPIGTANGNRGDTRRVSRGCGSSGIPLLGEGGSTHERYHDRNHRCLRDWASKLFHCTLCGSHGRCVRQAAQWAITRFVLIRFRRVQIYARRSLSSPGIHLALYGCFGEKSVEPRSRSNLI